MGNNELLKRIKEKAERLAKEQEEKQDEDIFSPSNVNLRNLNEANNATHAKIVLQYYKDCKVQKPTSSEQSVIDEEKQKMYEKDREKLKEILPKLKEMYGIEDEKTK